MPKWTKFAVGISCGKTLKNCHFKVNKDRDMGLVLKCAEIIAEFYPASRMSTGGLVWLQERIFPLSGLIFSTVIHVFMHSVIHKFL